MNLENIYKMKLIEDKMKNEPSYKIIIFLLAAWIIIFLSLLVSYQIGY